MFVNEQMRKATQKRIDFANTIVVPAITTEQLWHEIETFGLQEVDLLKLDCEGAEYLVVPELSARGVMNRIGWIRGEWHYRKQNPILASALIRTHAFNIDLSLPHDVGLFIAHRL